MSTQAQQEAMIARWIQKPPEAMYILGVGEKTEAETLQAIYPEMKIYGCDPNPVVISRIQDRFPGTLQHFGISNNECETLRYAADNTKSGTMQNETRPDSLDVDCVTLDHFDQICGQPWDILLWADIEGWELTALKSGQDLLYSGRVTWINLEERSATGSSTPICYPDPREIERFLQQFGYVKHTEYNIHPTHHDTVYRLASCQSTSP